MGSYLPIRWPSKDYSIALLIGTLMLGLLLSGKELGQNRDLREIGLVLSILAALWFIWSLIMSRELAIDAAVRRRTTELSALVSYLQGSRESDRLALSQELHDELGALLTLAKLDASRLKSTLPNMPPEACDRLRHLINTLNDGLSLKTKIINSLRPQTLSHLGLKATLENYVQEFSRRSNIQIGLGMSFDRLDERVSLTVFRLIQESLTNVLRHAQACHLTLTIEEQASELKIVIQDDGKGFDPALTHTGAYGISGMTQRAQSLGGNLVR
jgi:signal transduction histidine kinase